jgi:hypothetical protein
MMPMAVASPQEEIRAQYKLKQYDYERIYRHFVERGEIVRGTAKVGMAVGSTGSIGTGVYYWWHVVMIYDRRYRRYDDGCDGQWHCPFPPEWVERMKKAAKHCETVTEAQVIATLNNEAAYYVVPPGDFLNEPQDKRGLPFSWCRKEEYKYRKHPKCCTAIYDYDTTPELVVTDGYDDWELRMTYKTLTA